MHLSIYMTYKASDHWVISFVYKTGLYITKYMHFYKEKPISEIHKEEIKSSGNTKKTFLEVEVQELCLGEWEGFG